MLTMMMLVVEESTSTLKMLAGAGLQSHDTSFAKYFPDRSKLLLDLLAKILCRHHMQEQCSECISEIPSLNITTSICRCVAIHTALPKAVW